MLYLNSSTPSQLFVSYIQKRFTCDNSIQPQTIAQAYYPRCRFTTYLKRVFQL